jgi:hypothetical protein
MTDDNKPLPPLPHDPQALTPDELRDEVQRTLSTLSEEDRAAWCQRLLDGLAQAGVNISATLFMLGLVASRLDELTPPDVAKLLRYSRINNPQTIEALAGPLAELLVVNNEEPALAATGEREAAWPACCPGEDHEPACHTDQPLPLLGYPPRAAVRSAADTDLL